MPAKVIKSIFPMFKRQEWRIVCGDLVEIVTGRDRGKQGRVLAVYRDNRVPKVLVEDRNLVKKRVPQGEDDFVTLTVEAPIHYSNVQLVDPVTNKPVRADIKYKKKTITTSSGKTYTKSVKVRIGRGRNASGKIIEWPKPAQPDKEYPEVEGTPPDEAGKESYSRRDDFPELRLYRQYSTLAALSPYHHIAGSSFAAHGLLCSCSITAVNGQWASPLSASRMH